MLLGAGLFLQKCTKDGQTHQHTDTPARQAQRKGTSYSSSECWCVGVSVCWPTGAAQPSRRGPPSRSPPASAHLRIPAARPRSSWSAIAAGGARAATHHRHTGTSTCSSSSMAADARARSARPSTAFVVAARRRRQRAAAAWANVDLGVWRALGCWHDARITSLAGRRRICTAYARLLGLSAAGEHRQSQRRQRDSSETTAATAWRLKAGAD